MSKFGAELTSTLKARPSGGGLGRVRFRRRSFHPPKRRINRLSGEKGLTETVHHWARGSALDDGSPGRLVVYEKKRTSKGKAMPELPSDKHHREEFYLTDELVTNGLGPTIQKVLWHFTFEDKPLVRGQVKDTRAQAPHVGLVRPISEDQDRMNLGDPRNASRFGLLQQGEELITPHPQGLASAPPLLNKAEDPLAGVSQLPSGEVAASEIEQPVELLRFMELHDPILLHLKDFLFHLVDPPGLVLKDQATTFL